MSASNKPHAHLVATEHADWITAQEFASEYHVGRSTAYEAFKRLKTIRIGGCVRARRSEIEEKLARYGRI